MISGSLQLFSKKLGVGMINMRFGDLQTLVQKTGGPVFLGYHKMRLLLQ